MSSIRIEPGKTYINGKGRRRTVLAVVRGRASSTKTRIFYRDIERQRGEKPQTVINMVNRILNRRGDNWVPREWGIAGESDLLNIFSCQERAFIKWVGKDGQVEDLLETSTPARVSTSHQAAKALLALPNLPLVHPGIAGDIYIETVYHDEKDAVIVVSDRVEASAGSETGRHAEAVRLERERCVQLVEYRIGRLLEVLKDYPPSHSTHVRIAAAIENLRAVAKWISSEKQPKDTVKMNPGGSA
tara:strand:+ start:687 stop:1418 length:732 start_codon:yes stop_codon:yes gene_type:complete